MSEYLNTNTEHLMGDALQKTLAGIMQYVDLYRVRFDAPVGEDYVLAPHVQEILKGLLGLLNGPTGRLDCGHVDRRIRALANLEGLDGDAL